MNLIEIWKNRNQILEGVKNNVFKKEHVEEIAFKRYSICNMCPFMDFAGTKCVAIGTQPCCGECGCSLKYKTRSLSSSCPKGYWKEVVNEEEEELITKSIEDESNI